MHENRIGNIYGEDKGTGYAGNVWDKESISPALTTMQGGGREPMIIESQIVAMRGREEGQQLEPRSDYCTNTITTVQKDNMILESVKFGNAANSNQRCAVYDVNALAPTIQAAAGTGGNQQPMWIEVKQATKEGSIPCKIGGGGRLELSNKQNKKGQSSRERTDKSNTDNGEYP